MAIAATLTVYNAPYGIDQTAVRSILRGKLVWAAGTYAAGGVTPNAPPYADVSGANVLLATQNVQPDSIDIKSVAGSGFIYQRNNSTGKIQIFTTGSAAGSALEELPNGALPAGVTGDVIEFEASWVRA
ncbi:MAG TPA: hypothetical protein VFB43_17985 [Terracidiphilus sp.]|nr:hypothetical protein [Terracidiphilus sp.]